MQAMQAPKKHARKRPHGDRVYLLHADELYYDMFGNNPDAQILKGKVSFLHQGSHLTCDSAYFYQASNSVKAFGHVHYRQGDTLSLTTKPSNSKYPRNILFKRVSLDTACSLRKRP
jgi:lipopolysaccharide assembly outer membrane protein LptD (OstA)